MVYDCMHDLFTLATCECASEAAMAQRCAPAASASGARPPAQWPRQTHTSPAPTCAHSNCFWHTSWCPFRLGGCLRWDGGSLQSCSHQDRGTRCVRAARLYHDAQRTHPSFALLSGSASICAVSRSHSGVTCRRLAGSDPPATLTCRYSSHREQSWSACVQLAHSTARSRRISLKQTTSLPCRPPAPRTSTTHAVPVMPHPLSSGLRESKSGGKSRWLMAF